MKADIDLKQIPKQIFRFFHRFHIMIFTLSTIGGLAIATFILYNTVNSSQTSNVTQPHSGFDEKTIERINKLRSSDEVAPPLVLPNGRTNPFQE